MQDQALISHVIQYNSPGERDVKRNDPEVISSSTDSCSHIVQRITSEGVTWAAESNWHDDAVSPLNAFHQRMYHVFWF